ncbi:SET domain-containing protein [Pycnococcus provasolii]
MLMLVTLTMSLLLTRRPLELTLSARSGWQRANETVAKNRTKKKTPASQLADVVAQASSWAERMNENQTFQSAFRSRGTGSGAEVGHNNNQVKAVPSFRNDLASLDSHVEFKATQFVRTLVYEMAPPAINTLTVLLFETIIFKHTFHQAWRCVLARFLLPVPFCGPVLRLIGDSSWELNIANFCFYILENGIWVSLFIVVLVPEIRDELSTLELVPICVLFVVRATVLALKYAYLPVNYVGGDDVLGLMYTKEFSIQTMYATLVLNAWNNPHGERNLDKEKKASEVLRCEMEAACMVADVRLDDIEVHVGTEAAAAAIRAAALGVGQRSTALISASPKSVSAKELLASIISAHYGKGIPEFMNNVIYVVTLVFAGSFPAVRAICGAPAFGTTHLGKLACVSHFFYCINGFLVNLAFATSAAWDFRRRRFSLESLASMLVYPGERAANLGERAEKATRDDVEAGQRYSSAAGRGGNDQSRIYIDVKNPSSCLAWSLVRRAVRKVGTQWMYRMNAYSVVFLVAAMACTGALQALYYGVDAYPHRLVSAVGLFMVAMCISFLCSFAVFEAARINEAVPDHLMILKREMVALAAALAGSTFDDEGEGRKSRMEATLHLLKQVSSTMQHEELVCDPFVVFGRVTAGPGAIGATVGVLISMLIVALQRLSYLLDQGWNYSGRYGEFVAPD